MADPEKISVVVKPTSAQGTVKYTLETRSDSTVLELKEALSQHANIPAAEQRLIYKGQILKDDNKLESYGIANEHVIHLVRSRAAQATNSNPSATATSTPAPGPAAATATPLAPGAGLMPPGMGNPMEMMGNPEMMSQMLNNPMVQSMLNNPELMRGMLASNPAVQQLIERNPELGAIMTDPAVLRQSLQIASNPALMREHMRHSDRAMSNLESMPEGFNALRRMFETVQEPLMAAASEMDPMANLMGSDAAGGAVLQRPGMREMMSSIMSNPGFMDQMLSSNPALRQMVEATPGMRDLLSNPATVDAMLNPAVMQAMQGSQNPMQQQMLQQMLGGGAGLGAGGVPGAGAPDLSGMMGMMNMFGPMMGGMGLGAQAPAADPQTQYASQLVALADMGFTDTAANISALQATGGNVHAAVDRLLGSM